MVLTLVSKFLELCSSDCHFIGKNVFLGVGTLHRKIRNFGSQNVKANDINIKSVKSGECTLTSARHFMYNVLVVLHHYFNKVITKLSHKVFIKCCLLKQRYVDLLTHIKYYMYVKYCLFSRYRHTYVCTSICYIYVIVYHPF